MTESSFYEKNTDSAVIALGFFDAVHVGHSKVISESVLLSKKLGVKNMVFTFDNNPAVYFGKDDKLLCTYKERVSRMMKIGVDEILFAPCNEKFFNITPIDFLLHLKDNLNIVGIVCGKDYTFGKFGQGDTKMLNSFCDYNGIECVVVDEVLLDGNKIASRNIRKMLEMGKIKEATEMLGYYYTLEGIVVKGRGDGKKSIFPTINLNFPKEKVIPKEGVYATKVCINDQSYACVTNIGSHPTFEDYSENIETHIIDFDGDLYGQTLSVQFVKRLRNIEKFDSALSLKKQISTDILRARLL